MFKWRGVGRQLALCRRGSLLGHHSSRCESTIPELAGQPMQLGTEKYHGLCVIASIVPPDTPVTNPLLLGPEAEAPLDLSAATPAKCLRAVMKNIIEMNACMDHVDRDLQDTSLEELYSPIEKQLLHLEYSWSVLKMMSFVDEQYNFKYLNQLGAQFHRSRSRCYQSKVLFKNFERLRYGESEISPFQRALCDKHIKEGQLAGLLFNDQERTVYNQAAETLNVQLALFMRNVETAIGRFKHKVTEPGILKHLPEEFIEKAGDEKGITVRLLDDHYNAFMKHCPERMQRWNLWRAYSNRAAHFVDRSISNSIVVDEIREQRHNIANVLGYKDYAQLSLSSKMAGSTDAVKALVNTLHERSKPASDKYIKELTEYVSRTGEFEGSELELWDIPYWKRKFVEDRFPLNEKSVKEYFPLPAVLSGLFNFAEGLFDVKIEEVDADPAHLWHPDVRKFNLYSTNGFAGSFILDLYTRPGKNYNPSVNFLTTRCDALNVKPFCVVSCSFPRPGANQPSLLEFENVLGLFHLFGYVLQHLPAEAPYHEVSGMMNLELDRVNFCSEFMKNWVVGDYKVAQSCSSHYETGKNLPREVFECLQQRARLDPFSLKEELYRSALDITLHTSREHWGYIIKDVWNTYMRPLTFKRKEDNHVCSFREGMIELPAGYFSKLWSKMLAADAFLAFKENPLSEEEEKELGIKFRETILAPGGGSCGSEVFRDFRGRDPAPDSILFVNHLHADQVKVAKQDDGVAKLKI